MYYIFSDKISDLFVIFVYPLPFKFQIRMNVIQKISTWLDFKRNLPKLPEKYLNQLLDYFQGELNFQEICSYRLFQHYYVKKCRMHVN